MLEQKIIDQIMAVRETGRTNMFDIRMVAQVAADLGHQELVEFLKPRANREVYCYFILTGEVR